MKKIEIELDDREYDFIQKIKSLYQEEEGMLPFERFLIRVGVGAYIKFILTGSILESQEADFLWSELIKIILKGYSEWIDEIKAADRRIPQTMFG